MSRGRKTMIVLLLGLVPATVSAGTPREQLRERNEELLKQLKEVHELTDARMEKVREIFNASGFIGQGNPEVTEHPVTPVECESKLAELSVDYRNPRFEKICGGKFMAPLYDPSKEEPEDAATCIDRFEFPDIPCAYPVVWVRAREAALLCEAVGKRICDAHEWEGACAGRLEPPDYRYDLAAGVPAEKAVQRMRSAHNAARARDKRWAYGPQYEKGICAAASRKSPECTGGSWKQCGSNTYPAGFFPECRSPLEVLDLHGNAAEHMNLPLEKSQLACRGSDELGYTEMKGSWFIFDRYHAHEDWCRWRAPFWHGSRVMDRSSHHNYHLGFRCCKTLDKP